MSLDWHIPRWPLSRWVELFWLAENYRPEHEVERVLPTGSAQLILTLADSPLRSRAVLLSPRAEWSTVRAAEQRSVLGIQFKPEGVFSFLGCPVARLAPGQTNLEDLWGALARELHERVAAATTPTARFRIVEEVLLRRGPLDRPLDQAVEFAVRRLISHPGGVRVSDLAEQVGMSQRWFVQRFTEQIGLAPKRFARVQRFRRAIREIESAREPDWVQLALGCGYYDQAHFIQDFRAFSGLTPTAYRNAAGNHPNHVPLA